MPRARAFLLVHSGAPVYCRAVSDHLIFISGASSGIGLAMARSVPYAGARVIDISRRGAAGVEHFSADLAEPAEWTRIAHLFEAEIKGFAGERVVFVHCAGTLEPIGFAGGGDQARYGAGKAAVDQWVRTAGAEQKRRGGRCRVLSVAPGVIATAMQEQIRAMTEEAFPVVERFRELHRAGALRDPADAARDLWALVSKDTFPNGAVLDLREG